MLPAMSMANPVGYWNRADVGSKATFIALAIPATVDIMPVLAVIFRMRLFHVSEMYMFPDASNATFVGLFRQAAVARMSSPL